MTNLCTTNCYVNFENNQPGYQNQFVAYVYLPEPATQASNFDVNFTAEYDGNIIYVSVSVFVAEGDTGGSNATNYGLWQTNAEYWNTYDSLIVSINPTDQFDLIDCSVSTTTTTLAPSTSYTRWNVAQESFVGVICNSITSYTYYTATGYTLAPLTIPCFYTDTTLLTKFNPGYRDVLGYVKYPASNSIYKASMMINGNLSGQTACPNYYQYLITQVGQSNQVNGCAYLRDVYVYANTNTISEVTAFYTNTGLTTLWLPNTYGYVSYSLVSYPPYVAVGSIPNVSGQVTFSGSCAYYPTTTTTTTIATSSYKKKYWLQFTGEDKVRNLVDIYQNTYGSLNAEEIKGMESPFLVEMPNVSKFTPTRGTGCELNLLSKTDRYFYDGLYHVDPKEILLKHTRVTEMNLDPTFVYPSDYTGTTTTTTASPTTTTTTTSICDVHYTGETYQGGTIFYTWSGGTSGYIMMNEEIISTELGCYNYFIGGTTTSLGDGENNTIILSVCGGAASICSGLSYSGYTDWWLPSLDEFSQAIGIVSGLTGWYWTSSEYNNTYAWAIKEDGTQDNTFVHGRKYYTNHIRAIRKFVGVPCPTTTTTTLTPTTTTTTAIGPTTTTTTLAPTTTTTLAPTTTTTTLAPTTTTTTLAPTTTTTTLAPTTTTTTLAPTTTTTTLAPTTTTTTTLAPTTTTTSAPTTTTTTTSAGQVMDYDGNVYNTVNIDGTIWMLESFRGTKTSGGTSIESQNYEYVANNLVRYKRPNSITIYSNVPVLISGFRYPTRLELDHIATKCGAMTYSSSCGYNYDHPINNIVNNTNDWCNGHVSGSCNSSGFSAIPETTGCTYNTNLASFWSSDYNYFTCVSPEFTIMYIRDDGYNNQGGGG